MVVAVVEVGIPVTFTMSSDITATIFRHISPFQTEIVIQPRGSRIPVVSTLLEVSSRVFEIKQAMACLVRDEMIVLVWANSVTAAISHGSQVEHMLMESVGDL